ncbi:MAG: sigma-70 family RNA polymerase sigma factor [Acidimicrobiia bacterium]
MTAVVTPRPGRSASRLGTMGRYLHDIGAHPLLTAADEARLGARVQAGEQARRRLAGLARSVEVVELERVVTDGDEAVEAFVRANLRVVVSIAKRYARNGDDLADLVQEGNLGLIQAVKGFDFRKGFRFSTYATWSIRQAVERGRDGTRATIHIPTGISYRSRLIAAAHGTLLARLARPPTDDEMVSETGLTLEQVRATQRIPKLAHVQGGEPPTGASGPEDLAADGTDVESEVMATLLRAEIDGLLSYLEPREQQVLSLRFGLDRGEPRTLDEVAELMPLCSERIRQIERRALAKLRHPATGHPGATS